MAMTTATATTPTSSTIHRFDRGLPPPGAAGSVLWPGAPGGCSSRSMGLRSITCWLLDAPSRGATPLSQGQAIMVAMPSAVIFDFYGTLAKWADNERAFTYETIFAAHGYELSADVRDYYFSRYDGVDHAEHSVDEAAYERWVRSRLRDLVDSCGVQAHDADDLIEALRRADQGEMTAYPEAAETLGTLRDAG